MGANQQYRKNPRYNVRNADPSLVTVLPCYLNKEMVKTGGQKENQEPPHLDDWNRHLRILDLE
ncbi:hypothetical protein NBRC116494_10720 [Aurantivibrio plasticivorans]